MRYTPNRPTLMLTMSQKTPKTQSSFKLSPQVVQMISELAEHFGVSSSSIVEMAVRVVDPELIGEPRILSALERDRASVSPLGTYPYWLSGTAKERIVALKEDKGLASQAIVIECAVRHLYEGAQAGHLVS